jgi:hypothetical protein
MEKMPYQPDMDRTMDTGLTTTETVTTDWRQALPVLSGEVVTLRELEIADAPSLFAMLTTEEVSRFISPPPTTVEGFERFIAWTQRERKNGTYLCFAVVPHGMTTAVGSLSGSAARAGVCDRGVGLCDWVGFLGDGHLHGCREDGRGLRYRYGRRASARGACGGGQRTRQRRASQARRRAGRASSEGPSSATDSISTRCCGRFFTTSGGRPRLSGAPRFTRRLAVFSLNRTLEMSSTFVTKSRRGPGGHRRADARGSARLRAAAEDG